MELYSLYTRSSHLRENHRKWENEALRWFLWERFRHRPSEKIRDFVFYLSCKYDDWNLRLNLYKLAIFAGDEKEIKGIQSSFPVMINDALLTKGTYLYGNVSGFKAQRVPVSYTHLDVYKRQHHRRATIISLIPQHFDLTLFISS